MIAIDTNILVYCYDRTEPRKRQIAVELIPKLALTEDPVLLWQVAGEFLNQLTNWQNRGMLDEQDVTEIMKSIRNLFPIVLPLETSIEIALDLRSRYSLQHWDSMLLAACRAANVTTLYTEDMGSPRRIDELELLNPFDP